MASIWVSFARSVQRKTLVLATLAVGVALALVFGCRTSRLPKASAERAQGLWHVLIGLRNYNDGMHRVPLAVERDAFGRARYSWRYSVLLFIEQTGVPWDKDAVWYDPVDRYFAGKPQWCYCYPDNPRDPIPLTTSVMTLTGPGTAFDGAEHKFDDLPQSLILCLEARNSTTHWMEPGDLNVADLPPSLTEGADGKGLLVGFADLQVWRLDSKVPVKNVRPFFTIDGAARSDRDRLLGPYRKGRYTGRGRVRASDAPSETDRGDEETATHGNRDQAMARIEKLGGVFGRGARIMAQFTGIVLGPKWHGGNEGLATLKELGRVDELTLDSPALDDEAIPHLKTLRGLGALYLGETRISDRGLAELAALPNIDLVQLDGPGYTDASLERLRGLNLRWLILGPKARITDAGLAHLGSFPKLLYLGISAPAVTGQGLSHLAGIPELRVLVLRGSGVNDRGLASLPRLDRLSYLDISATRIGDAGVADLKRFAELRELLADDTAISDQGLQSVGKTGQLETLSVNGTRVSDSGMRFLSGLDALSTVSAERTQVGDAGLRELARLPNLRTARDGSGNVVIFNQTWAASTQGGGRLVLSEANKNRLFLWRDSKRKPFAESEYTRLRPKRRAADSTRL